MWTKLIAFAGLGFIGAAAVPFAPPRAFRPVIGRASPVPTPTYKNPGHHGYPDHPDQHKHWEYPGHTNSPQYTPVQTPAPEMVCGQGGYSDRNSRFVLHWDTSGLNWEACTSLCLDQPACKTFLYRKGTCATFDGTWSDIYWEPAPNNGESWSERGCFQN